MMVCMTCETCKWSSILPDRNLEFNYRDDATFRTMEMWGMGCRDHIYESGEQSNFRYCGRFPTHIIVDMRHSCGEYHCQS